MPRIETKEAPDENRVPLEIVKSSAGKGDFIDVESKLEQIVRSKRE